MIEGQAMPGAACAPDAWNGNTLMVKRIVELFYADEDTEPEQIAQAKAICCTCPVRQRCLDVNLHEQYGVWGGTTESERRILRKPNSKETS